MWLVTWYFDGHTHYLYTWLIFFKPIPYLSACSLPGNWSFSWYLRGSGCIKNWLSSKADIQRHTHIHSDQQLSWVPLDCGRKQRKPECLFNTWTNDQVLNSGPPYLVPNTGFTVGQSDLPVLNYRDWCWNYLFYSIFHSD